ncbi:MAG: hypothetical protein ACREUL_11840 [Steroidobacteraceae bacterium]
MGISRRIGIAVVTAALAAGSGIGSAADPPQQKADPPPGLLEFLGSVDPPTDSRQPDNRAWLAYLAQINTGKVASASQAPAQPKPASPAAGTEKPGGG